MPIKKSWTVFAENAKRVVDRFNPDLSYEASLIPGELKLVVSDLDRAIIGWKTKDLTEVMVTLTIDDNGNIHWDVAQGNFAQVTLTSNATLHNLTNRKAGGVYILIVRQDTTGNRTLNFASLYRWPQNENPAPDPSPNSVTIYSFVCDGNLLYGTVVKY